MLIREDGSAIGSVGGGCVEAEIWQSARDVLRDGQARLLQFSLTDDDAEAEGLICGGTVEIFVEPILADPEIVILGAGHLGRAIAELADQIGFRVKVLDDREEFANDQRFPRAAQILVQSFEKPLTPIDVRPDSFVLIVTRGHKHDQIALQRAIETEARYVGLVGSRRKIAILVKNLLEKGSAPERFRHLYAPIGLDIGSQTPEEIAVSVVAEIIAVRRGVHQRSNKQNFVLDLLNKIQEEQ